MNGPLAEDVFDFVEDGGIAVGGLVFHFERGAELFEELALLAGELSGSENANVIVEIAFAAAAWVGEAFSLDAENGAALRAFGDFELLVAIEAWDLELGAESGLRNAERNRAIEIGAATFKEGVLLDVKNHVEIAGSAAIGSWLAFTGDTEACAGINARGNAQLDGFFALNATLAAAIGAAFANDLAGTLTRGAGARNGEKALLIGELATAAAGLASDYASAFFRAGAVAGFAIFLARKFDFCGDAGGGFFKSERHVVTKIGAALLSAATGAASGEKILEAKEVAENIVEIAKDGAVEIDAATGAGKTGVAVGVVDFALLLVA